MPLPPKTDAAKTLLSALPIEITRAQRDPAAISEAAVANGHGIERRAAAARPRRSRPRAPAAARSALGAARENVPQSAPSAPANRDRKSECRGRSRPHSDAAPPAPCTEARVASQSQLNGAPARASTCRPETSPLHESMFMVANASPARSTRSAGRKSEMWPGECPGVASHSQPAKPGSAGDSSGRMRSAEIVPTRRHEAGKKSDRAADRGIGRRVSSIVSVR